MNGGWTWPVIPFHWPTWQQVFPNGWPAWPQWSLPVIAESTVLLLLIVFAAGVVSYHFSAELRDYIDRLLDARKLRKQLRKERDEMRMNERGSAAGFLTILGFIAILVGIVWAVTFDAVGLGGADDARSGALIIFGVILWIAAIAAAASKGYSEVGD